MQRKLNCIAIKIVRRELNCIAVKIIMQLKYEITYLLKL